MAADPLNQVGRWSASETVFESAAPLVVMAGSWYIAYRLLGGAASGRPFTAMELATLLGSCVAATTWSTTRLLALLGRRRLGSIIVVPAIVAGTIIFGLETTIPGAFARVCTSTIHGQLVTITGFVAGTPDDGEEPATEKVCQVRSVPGNPYLPGTFVHAAWDGNLSGNMLLLLASVGFLSALAFRDQRLRATKIPEKLYESLRLSPATGSASVVGGLSKTGGVQACGNPTLWAEPCGQLYNGDREMQPGEWCIRCQQVYHRNERDITLSVVSLTTIDIDVLNGLERLDTTSWDRGTRKDPDPRISGEERWAILGDIVLPDVVTVAQALALVHERLKEWAGSKDPRVQKAANIAASRASRICAWIWFGRVSQQLTDARPTTDVRFAIGSLRLRDLVGDRVESLVLQLDTGLLPLELRTGFRMMDLEGKVRAQNSRSVVWVPVSPKSAKDGVWVDRIEGEALRAWLGTERLQREQLKGTAMPLPYLPYVSANKPEPVEVEEEGTEGTDPMGAASVRAPVVREASRPDPYEKRKITEGSLDFIRVPLTDADEVAMDEAGLPLRSIGDAISEWGWFEWEQIQLMRQQALVLVEAGR